MIKSTKVIQERHQIMCPCCGGEIENKNEMHPMDALDYALSHSKYSPHLQFERRRPTCAKCKQHFKISFDTRNFVLTIESDDK